MRTLITTLCVITADWKLVTVGPHHSRLPYLQIRLVLKFICDPKLILRVLLQSFLDTSIVAEY